MVSRRDVPGRASHAKSSSYCDSVHTLMLFSPPSGTTPLAEDAEPSPSRQQEQSSPRSPPRPRSKPSPLKILVRAFNACRRGRNNNARASKDSPSSSSSTPRAASPVPTMSAHEAAAIRRILAVPSQHSLTFASNSSSTTSLGLTPRPSDSPSVASRASSSTYYTAASFVESPYPSLRRSLTAPALHPYALAAPVYE
ncbi:hypothetical protein FRC04_002064 [Tulasnella sp. 424]|nr:hypothetical protein FRC04_002064 [Tulasnella sp. 424]KAG8975542.1 hypothetical protein FRC05_005611 [Tulasnella sp. 425]